MHGATTRLDAEELDPYADTHRLPGRMKWGLCREWEGRVPFTSDRFILYVPARKREEIRNHRLERQGGGEHVFDSDSGRGPDSTARAACGMGQVWD